MSQHALKPVADDIEHYKEVITVCWEQNVQGVIDYSIAQFHRWLSLVIAVGMNMWNIILIDQIDW